MINNYYEYYNRFCCPCVGSNENKNLYNAQRDLLLWHLIWLISMHSIKETMNPKQVKEPDSTRHVMAQNIVRKLATDAKWAVSVCESCLFDRYNKRSPGVSRVKAVPEKEWILARDKYEAGDFFPQINSLCARLEDFHIDMFLNVAKIDFTAVPYIMMPRLV